MCGALWVFFSARPPFSPPALRLFSPLRCLSGAVSVKWRWRRRRHGSHRKDRRRRRGLLWLFCDGAFFRCSLDLNKKGRFFTRASPSVASGRLRPPPAAFSPRNTRFRPPHGGRSALGGLWGCLGWLGRAHLDERRARCIFSAYWGGVILTPAGSLVSITSMKATNDHMAIGGIMLISHQSSKPSLCVGARLFCLQHNAVSPKRSTRRHTA